MISREIAGLYLAPDVCGGNAPWKSRLEVTRATLALHREGVDVAGLSEEEVLKIYDSRNNPQNQEKTGETQIPRR